MQRWQNPMQMMSEFQRFKNNFRGDPKAEVERLVANGQINQQQLNQLQAMANQFQMMLGNK